ncbi:MAG: hypothetical protein MRK01_17505 [Candidatus Scalindua sp.]|nr:hypothetical protein [Candidatus Scalindua sp.]
MGKIKTGTSKKILKSLPPEQEKLEAILKLGLKQYNVRNKKEKKEYCQQDL